MLPDDVLLEMFDFFLGKVENDFHIVIYEDRQWIRLTCVSRRWRNVVFQSPRRLNLRLVCKPRTPAGDILGIWPPLPLIIHDVYDIYDEPRSIDNIIAALEHNDRVCEIKLQFFPISQLKFIANSAAMQKPFPELTQFLFGFGLLGEYDRRLPDSILGGNAPRLRSLFLSGVAFLGLPKLLFSTTHLVTLRLYRIPPSGYIPPEAMAASLSALTSLEYLYLHFQSPQPRPAINSRHPPRPLTRSDLPSLTSIRFKGASEYLEEILARIDAPRLNNLHIKFFNQIIFDTPQLSQFISRKPTLRAPEKGNIAFYSEAAYVRFPLQTSDYEIQLKVEILCRTSEWQLSSLKQVCTSSLPPVSTLEDLYIHKDPYGQLVRWQVDVENTLWLELLHPFVVVKNLYLSEGFVPRIAPALQELVGGRTTEVLPTLENIFMEGFQPSRPLHEGIEKFVAARGLTGHPVVVSRWDWDLERDKVFEQDRVLGL